MSDFKNTAIKFPLYEDDGKPLFIIFNNEIEEAIIRTNHKISSGFYKFILNSCLCGNETPESDLLIAEKDLWGISVDSLICSKCGLIRSKRILDQNSLADFYETDYKLIYYQTTEPNENMFISQVRRGEGFFKELAENNLISEVKTVFDYGCGMGGVLLPFFNSRMSVAGCDYSHDYLRCGSVFNDFNPGCVMFFERMVHAMHGDCQVAHKE